MKKAKGIHTDCLSFKFFKVSVSAGFFEVFLKASNPHQQLSFLFPQNQPISAERQVPNKSKSRRCSSLDGVLTGARQRNISVLVTAKERFPDFSHS